MQIVALKPLCAVVALTGAVAVAWAYRAPAPARPVPHESQLCPAPPEAQASWQRGRVKRQLARRVIAERIPLPEAAELFRRANGEDGLVVLARGTSGRSMREKLCHQVIMYTAEAEAEMRAEGWTSCAWDTAELEADFKRRLAAGEFPPEPGAE